MKKFWTIFSLAFKYKKNLWGSLVFNILNAILSLFTFFTLIPLLQVLFKVGEENPEKPTTVDHFSGEYWFDLLTYRVSEYSSINGPIQTLIVICTFTVGLALVKNFVYYISLRNIAVIRTGVARDLREKLYKHVVKLSLGYFSNERKGDIISRMTNDLFEVEFSTIGAVEALFKAPILIFFYMATLFLMSWELTLFSLIFLPLSGYMISLVAKSLKNAANKGKVKLGELLIVLEETLSGMRIIKAFNAEAAFNEKFDKKNDDYFRLMMKLYKKEYLSSPMSEFISIIVLCILLFFGGRLILSGNHWMEGTAFLAYLVIFSQIIPPARALSDAVFRIKKGEASLDRINDIIHAEIEIQDSENPVGLKEFTQKIEFKDVRFSYENEEVIKGINITINKGETVALVGPSGGGKSTLANLITRFYDVSGGEVLIDGISIKDLKLHDLKSLMGIVSQDSILFNDSVRNNITLGSNERIEEDIIRAAKISNSEEFILGLEGGYSFNVGDGGGKLSGGQKQRLSIARAIYKNPPILILDEATSALDTQSEKLVQGAINNLMENRTALVIAHRLSTIQSADKIVVIEKGMIAEQGTHSELMANGKIYKALVEMQEFD